MKATVIGNGTLTKKCLDILLESKWTIESVISQNIDIASFCIANEITLYPTITHWNKEKNEADYLFSIINEEILTEHTLAKIKKLSINYHDSLLPKFAGIHSTAHAIKYGKKNHGVSWHVINEGIDTGDILTQEEIKISPEDTTESLNLKCFSAGTDTFKKLLYNINNIKRKKQDLTKRSYYGFQNNFYEDSILEWNNNADEILKYIRACQFGNTENLFGLAIINVNNQCLFIKKAKIEKGVKSIKPGSVTINTKGIYISAQDYQIKIISVENGLRQTISEKDLKSILRGKVITHKKLPKLTKKTVDKERAILKLIIHSDFFNAQNSMEPVARKRLKVALNHNEQYKILALITVLFIKFIGKDSICIWCKTHHLFQANKSKGLEFTFIKIDKDDITEDTSIHDLIVIIKNKIEKSPIVDPMFFLRHRNISPPHFYNNSNYIVDQTCLKINQKTFDIYFNEETPQHCNVNPSAFCQLICALKPWFEKSNHVKIRSLDMLSKEKIENILNSIKSRKKNTLEKNNINLWMKDIIKKFPNRIALTHQDTNLTYGDIDILTHKISSYLNLRGLKAGDAVLIALKNPVEIIISMLSIIKAGGHYIPISLNYPEKRINKIISMSKTRFLISKKEHRTKFSETLTFVDFEKAEKNVIEVQAPDGITESSLLYVIFTSGTTGQPKGVKIPHSNLVRLFKVTESLFNFSHKDNWVFFHSHCFDFSTWEMFGALLYGGTLFIPSEQERRNPADFVKFICKNKITILNQTPSYFNYLSNPLAIKIQKKESILRCIIFGGEKLYFDLLKPFMKANKLITKLVNMYGITESTIHTTYHDITSEDISKNASIIGRPLLDIDYLILNESQQLVADNVWGELYLAGPCLSSGYLNDKKLTNERFIRLNKLCKNKRFYKTGDIVRRVEEGSLEYLGRNDNIIKMRGYRISLDEVANAINNFPQVKIAIAICIKERNENKLVVYFKSASEKFLRTSLIKQIRLTLPEYMLPSRIVEVDNFPLNSNGKINITLLERSYWEVINNTPIDKNIDFTKKALEDTWSTYTGSTNVKSSDNFFSVGGSSLRAIQFSSLIYKNFNLTIELEDIYKLKTFGKIYRFLTNSKDNISFKCNKCLTKKQEAIWFSNKIIHSNSKFNIGFSLVLRKNIDLKKLKKAIEYTLDLHPELKTLFSYENNRIKTSTSCSLLIFDISVNSQHEQSAFIRQDFNKEFNISKSTCFFYIIKNKELNSISLYFKAHHIIIDGLSLMTLISLIFRHYNHHRYAKKIESIPQCYFDESSCISEKKSESILKKIVSRASRDYFNAFSIGKNSLKAFVLDDSIVCKVNRLANRLNVTSNLVFLAAFYITMFQYAEGKNPLIGISINCKKTSQSNLLGTYVNLLPFSTDKLKDLKIPTTDFIKNVNEIVRDLLQIKNIPFDIVSKIIRKTFNNIESPMPIIFNYNDFSLKYSNDDFVLHTTILRPKIPKFNFSLDINHYKNITIVEINTSYNMNITLLAKTFIEKINTLITHNEIKNPDFIDSHTEQKIPANKTKNNKNVTEIENALVSLICNHLVLQPADIDKDEGFFNLGLNSLDLIKICDDLKSKYNITLTPIEFFKNPSISQITSYLLQ